MLATLHACDRRGGGIETQNKGDKQGLGLSHRNKQCFATQEMLVLLGQLAHDLVIWTLNDFAQIDPRFRKYGIEWTVRDVLQIDGRIAMNAEGKIQSIFLNENHPFSTLPTS